MNTWSLSFTTTTTTSNRSRTVATFFALTKLVSSDLRQTEKPSLLSVFGFLGETSREPSMWLRNRLHGTHQQNPSSRLQECGREGKLVLENKTRYKEPRGYRYNFHAQASSRKLLTSCAPRTQANIHMHQPFTHFAWLRLSVALQKGLKLQESSLFWRILEYTFSQREGYHETCSRLSCYAFQFRPR